MAILERNTHAAEPAKRLAVARVQGFFRASGIVLLAGMVGGVVWGVGARAAMRVVALAAGHRPDFSWAGTLGILLLGAFCGILVSLPYLAVRRVIPGGWRRRALGYGLLALLLLAAPVYLSPQFQEESRFTGQLGLAIALFAPLLVVFGATVAGAYEALDRRLLRAGQGRAATVLGVTLLLLPVLFAGGIGALLYLTSTGRIRL